MSVSTAQHSSRPGRCEHLLVHGDSAIVWASRCLGEGALGEDALSYAIRVFFRFCDHFRAWCTHRFHAQRVIRQRNTALSFVFGVERVNLIRIRRKGCPVALWCFFLIVLPSMRHASGCGRLSQLSDWFLKPTHRAKIDISVGISSCDAFELR